jgi:hypothetical protein
VHFCPAFKTILRTFWVTGSYRKARTRSPKKVTGKIATKVTDVREASRTKNTHFMTLSL